MTTKIYDGVIVSNNGDGRWNIRYNGEVHSVRSYGNANPTVDQMVKVFVPQGNQNLAWFITPPIEGGGGGSGTSGVDSFNGRTGTVISIAGDYTAAMVGARPNTWLPTPDEIGAVPETTTVNGKSLSSNVTLTGNDIAVSGTDNTTVTTMLNNKANAFVRQLVAGDDLDDVVTWGSYFVTSTNARQVANLPVQTALQIYVLLADDGTTSEERILQVAIEQGSISNDIWMRKHRSTGWSDWWAIPNDTLSNLSNYQKALANIGGRPRKNLVHNWYFAGGGSQQGGGQFPINQSGGTASMDGWSVASTASITLGSDGVIISATAKYGGMTQVVCNLEVGKTYTLTGLVVGTDGTGRPYMGVYQNVDNTFITQVKFQQLTSGAEALASVSFVAPASALKFTVTSSEIGQIEFKAVKLEEGTGQTLAYQDSDGNWQLFETPDYLETLQQCQRYLYVQPARYGSFAGYLSNDATEVFFSVPIGVQMAKALNISYDFVSIFNESGMIFDTRDEGVFTPSVVMPDGNSVYVRASLGTAVGTANQCVVCQIAGLTITGTD